MKKRRIDFDGALKEFFETERPGLLSQLTGGKGVKQFLNVELPTVRTRKVDLLLLLEDDTILHVELQSGNHRDMAMRMAEYYLLLVRKYKVPVRQVVLYLGPRRMNMPNRVDHPSMQFSYELRDIRSWNADELLASNSPADHVLALLAGGRPDSLQLIREVVVKIALMSGPAKQRALAFASTLSGLRGFETIVLEESINMGQILDFRKSLLYRVASEEGREEGREEGIAQGRLAMISVLKNNLSKSFGPLPKWALQVIETASMTQLQEWASKLSGAQTLESVIMPRN